MYKIKNVLLLAVGFMLLGLLTVFFTHDTVQKPTSFVSQESYAKHIKPWIDSVYIDQSLVSVSNIKNNLLNFKGADHSTGPAHIALFLAFDSWEQFLLTGDDASRQKSIDHFYSAADLLPEIRTEIKNLENILNQQNA